MSCIWKLVCFAKFPLFFCSNNFIYFILLATLLSVQDLDSLTRVQSRAPAVEVQSLNHWTTREALQSFLIHLLILVVCFGKKILRNLQSSINRPLPLPFIISALSLFSLLWTGANILLCSESWGENVQLSTVKYEAS